ncbi:hypothetical protein [Cohaesibacter celericrescens]|uniref:N-acetyltransferase domain-containing protein n=1 Tax=Cohaesibacter celericrescens TaxID=2067669 RepID=A0A2N5XLK9_9HYPH|nr:hypothetical protein [Cohaesibacter celericrescens]PLW75409.1 hypothetical protein C0081_20295 [Cohaesibacter celericrescens]
MQINHDHILSSEVIDCLMETANLDYTTRESIAQSECLYVRENGVIIFALAFEVYNCPHGKELQVTGINGTRAKGFHWVQIALEKLETICAENEISRLTLMVESKRIRQLLDRMGKFMPMATMMGRIF